MNIFTWDRQVKHDMQAIFYKHFLELYKFSKKYKNIGLIKNPLAKTNIWNAIVNEQRSSSALLLGFKSFLNS